MLNFVFMQLQDSQWREPEDVWRSRYHAAARAAGMGGLGWWLGDLNPWHGKPTLNHSEYAGYCSSNWRAPNMRRWQGLIVEGGVASLVERSTRSKEHCHRL